MLFGQNWSLHAGYVEGHCPRPLPRDSAEGFEAPEPEQYHLIILTPRFVLFETWVFWFAFFGLFLWWLGFFLGGGWGGQLN